MKLSTVTKMYVRHREDYPESSLMFDALHGFRELGIETAPFYHGLDIADIPDLGPEVGICGFICDIQEGVKRMGREMPPPLDYPESLRPFMGRRFRKTTLAEVRAMYSPCFVKPVEQKRFTGFVWQGHLDPVSRRRVVLEDDDLEVWVSDVVDMVSEYRAIVLDGEVLDVRRYKGDWSVAPSREFIEEAVGSFRASGEAPVCYTLDFAVLGDWSTVLVEANDGFSFGNYGMPSISYANCLACRWQQLAGV